MLLRRKEKAIWNTSERAKPQHEMTRLPLSAKMPGALISPPQSFVNGHSSQVGWVTGHSAYAFLSEPRDFADRAKRILLIPGGGGVEEEERKNKTTI